MAFFSPFNDLAMALKRTIIPITPYQTQPDKSDPSSCQHRESEENSSSDEDGIVRTTSRPGDKSSGSSRSRLFRNRTRFNLNRGTSTTENPQPQTKKPLSVTKNLLRGRDRFRNLLNRTPNSTLINSAPSITEQSSSA